MTDNNAEEILSQIEIHHERTTAYYTALGRFVVAFATLETMLQKALWRVAALDRPVAQAVFNGPKIEGCIQAIKRIAAAKQWSGEKKARLDEIVARIGPINRLRNDILHYGVSMDLSQADAWTFTNAGYVHVAENIRESTITPSLLDDASSDLRKLFYLVIFLALEEIDPNLALQTAQKLADLVLPAWLYKSPPPAS